MEWEVNTIAPSLLQTKEIRIGEQLIKLCDSQTQYYCNLQDTLIEQSLNIGVWYILVQQF